MTGHLYRADEQPATRICLPGPPEITLRYGRRELLWCHDCRRRRRAANLVAFAYYDHVRLACRRGWKRGCRPAPPREGAP